MFEKFKKIFKKDEPKPEVKAKPIRTAASKPTKAMYETLTGQARRVKVELHKLVEKTACGHHAWYDSNVGLIRKPIQPYDV